MEVRHAVRVNHDVFQHRAKTTGGGENGRFIFLREVDEFGITSAFEIEDAVRTPTVLVIPDEGPLWIGGEGGFTSA